MEILYLTFSFCTEDVLIAGQGPTTWWCWTHIPHNWRDSSTTRWIASRFLQMHIGHFSTLLFLNNWQLIEFSYFSICCSTKWIPSRPLTLFKHFTFNCSFQTVDTHSFTLNIYFIPGSDSVSTNYFFFLKGWTTVLHLDQEPHPRMGRGSPSVYIFDNDNNIIILNCEK